MLLKERFRDDYKISEVWVSKVTETSVIRYGEGHRVQEMADDLRSSNETLGAMNKLEQIDTRRSMVKIVERLPQPLQNQWRRLLVRSLKTTNRYPSIAELVFLLMRSLILCSGFRKTRCTSLKEAVELVLECKLMSPSKVQDVGAGVATLRLRPLRSNMMSAVCGEGATA